MLTTCKTKVPEGLNRVASHVNGWKYGCYRETACRRYAINIGGIPKGTHSMAAIYPAIAWLATL